MPNFSVDRTGFAALTIVEFLIQEMVMKGMLTEADVKHLLVAAARRHEDAAQGDQYKIDMNMEAALLIRTLMQGLDPLFTRDRNSTKKKRERKPKPRTNERPTRPPVREEPGS